MEQRSRERHSLAISLNEKLSGMVNTYPNGTERSKGSLKIRTLGHQRKDPGKQKKVCITISDDEPDEELGKMGDD